MKLKAFHNASQSQSQWTRLPSDHSTIRPLNLKPIRDTHSPSIKKDISQFSSTRQSPIKTFRSGLQTQSQQFFPATVVTRRRIEISEHNCDENTEYFFKLQKIRNLYTKAFKQGSTEEAIQHICELMIVYACRNDVVGLLKTYQLAGETYSKLNNLASSIQAFTQLVLYPFFFIDNKQLQLCDLFHTVPKVIDELKPKAILKLAELAQQLKLYEVAVRFVKRTLQYAWQFQDETLELYCYDKLGQLAYLMSDLNKAKFYHDRASWGRPEPKSSINCKMGNQNLKWYLDSLEGYKLKNIDAVLTSKATFLPFYFKFLEEEENNPREYPINVTNKFMLENNVRLSKQPHRFITLVPYEQIFEQVMELEEFCYQISTPRVAYQDDQNNELKLSPMETFYNTLKVSANKGEKVYLQNLKNRMKKFNGFVQPVGRFDSRKLQWTYKLEQKLKKLPLQMVVNERVNLNKSRDKFNQERYQVMLSMCHYKIQVSKRSHSKLPLRDQIRISHLSPNRDLDMYSGSQSFATNPSLLFKRQIID